MSEDGVRVPNVPISGNAPSHLIGTETVAGQDITRRYPASSVLGETSAEISALQSQVAEHETEITTLDGRVNDHDEDISALQAGQGGAGLVFADKAEMDAELDYDEFTKAEVYDDPTPANNGVYQKVGASGTGSWTKVSDLAITQIFEIAKNAPAWCTLEGSSTANAIVLSHADIAAYNHGQIVVCRPTLSNTSAAVTANLNSIGLRAVVTQDGDVLFPGEIKANYDLVLRIDNVSGVYRIVATPGRMLERCVLIGAAGEGAGAITATAFPAVVAHHPYREYDWLPAGTNPGACTINISSLGPLPLREVDGSELLGGRVNPTTPLKLRTNVAGTEVHIHYPPKAEVEVDTLHEDVEALRRQLRRMRNEMEQPKMLELVYTEDFQGSPANARWRHQRDYLSEDTAPLLPVVNHEGTDCVEIDLAVHATTHRSRTSNVATLTIGSHDYEVGKYFSVQGVGGTGYNAHGVEITGVGPTTVSYASTGSNEGSTADTGGRVCAVLPDANHTFYTPELGVGWIQIPFVAAMSQLRQDLLPGKTLVDLADSEFVIEIEGEDLYIPDSARFVAGYYTYDPVLDQGRGREVYFFQARNSVHEALGYKFPRQEGSAGAINGPASPVWRRAIIPFPADEGDWQRIGFREGLSSRFSESKDAPNALRQVEYNIFLVFILGNTEETAWSGNVPPTPAQLDLGASDNMPPTDLPAGIIRIRKVEIWTRTPFVTLISETDTTGDWIPVRNGVYNWHVYGTFDGATASLQWSPDGATPISVDGASATANDGVASVPLADGYVRVLIASAGGSTSITSRLSAIKA